MEAIVRDICFSCKENVRDFILQKMQVAFCDGKQNFKKKFLARQFPCEFPSEPSINVEE